MVADSTPYLTHSPPTLISELTNTILAIPAPVHKPEQKHASASLLKTIRNNHNIVITEADKGNTIVALDHADHHQGKLKFLQNINAKHDSDFSFKSYNCKIRNDISMEVNTS